MASGPWWCRSTWSTCSCHRWRWRTSCATREPISIAWATRLKGNRKASFTASSPNVDTRNSSNGLLLSDQESNGRHCDIQLFLVPFSMKARRRRRFYYWRWRDCSDVSSQGIDRRLLPSVCRCVALLFSSVCLQTLFLHSPVSSMVLHFNAAYFLLMFIVGHIVNTSPLSVAVCQQFSKITALPIFTCIHLIQSFNQATWNEHSGHCSCRLNELTIWLTISLTISGSPVVVATVNGWVNCNQINLNEKSLTVISSVLFWWNRKWADEEGNAEQVEWT